MKLHELNTSRFLDVGEADCCCTVVLLSQHYDLFHIFAGLQRVTCQFPQASSQCVQLPSAPFTHH